MGFEINRERFLCFKIVLELKLVANWCQCYLIGMAMSSSRGSRSKAPARDGEAD
jgi:hypothetical protein